MDNREGKYIPGKVGYFEEQPGVRSSTRLFSFMLLIFAMVFNIIYVIKGKEITWPFVFLNLVFFIAVFTPKYLHKIAELLGVKRNGYRRNTTHETNGTVDINGPVK